MAESFRDRLITYKPSDLISMGYVKDGAFSPEEIKALSYMVNEIRERNKIGNLVEVAERFGVRSRDSIVSIYNKAKQITDSMIGVKRSPMGSKNPRRRAKMDLMTGFSNGKPTDVDRGLSGDDYFAKWTTVALPDTGKNDAIDDEDQPVGSGAPATTIPGAPLKVPMEASDVSRPKIREGREAKVSMMRKVAFQVKSLGTEGAVLARRLMAAADEMGSLSYDDLSTASLFESGDETNEVDGHQDKGHGTLEFWGTDAAKKTSLTRESSRRRGEYFKPESGSQHINWSEVEAAAHDLKSTGVTPEELTVEKVAKAMGIQEHGAAMKALPVVRKKLQQLYNKGEESGPESNLEYASRKSSRRRIAEAGGPGIDNIDWKNTLKLVEQAHAGKYDKKAVAQILKNEYERTVNLLNSGGSQQQVAPAATQPATASRKRARSQGDKSLKPEPTVGDQDGPGAEGTAAFIKRSKAPLQETMFADEVERPKIRENPEASKSLWATMKNELVREANTGGSWNEGRYTLSSRDYGNSLEVEANIVDSDRTKMPIGSIMFSVIHDSPNGRFASIEVNDNILENTTKEFSIERPVHARKIAKRLIGEIIETACDMLDSVAMS